MGKKTCLHNICIKVFDTKPSFKYNVEHMSDGEIMVSKKDKSEWKDHSVLKGEIIIGTYYQVLFIDCAIWNLQDYYYQWQEGLKRLDIQRQSCLVTNVSFVRGMHSVEWWFLYKIKNKIHVQYNITLGSMYKKIVGDNLFTPNTCYDFIPKRRIQESDGEKKSELIVDM